MQNYKSLFIGYLTFLFICTLIILTSLYNDTTNSMSEWVINYQGGFSRRGFLGEIIFQLSLIFYFELRKGFLFLQILSYFLYFLLIYKFFKNIEGKYLFFLAIFSPIFFFFSLAELEALGRKDIYMFVIFLGNLLIYEKYKNLKLNYLYFIITFPIMFLTHEIYIIYVPYFVCFLILFEDRIEYKEIIKIFLLLIFIFFFIYLINSIEFTSKNLDKLCENLLSKKNEECGLAPYSMVIDLAKYRSEVAWKFHHIFRYFLFFLIGSGSLILLIFFSKFKLDTNNFFLKKIDLRLIMVIIFLPSILPFISAVDSGRYLSMAYSFPCLFFFSLYKNDKIHIDFNKIKKKLNFINFTNKGSLIIFFIIVCFTWSPKAVYHEDTASIPIYRLIEKLPKFIPNFFKNITEEF